MRFAIVTPSYSLDFERCALLSQSIQLFVPKDIIHYIIVDASDLLLFSSLASDRTKILVQENLIAEKFRRLKFLPHWRFSWKMPPIRGWIWQQIVKLAIAQSIDAEVYMLVDSDCFFIRNYDPRTLIQNGSVPLFREEKAYYLSDSNTQKWHKISTSILGAGHSAHPYQTGYVGAHVFWRRDVLIALQAHLIERSSNIFGSWIGKIAYCQTFSEYDLYGMYVEIILGFDKSGHYIFDKQLVENYWPELSLDERSLAAFRRQIQPEKFMAMINAKSRTSVALIKKVFGFQ